MIKAGSLLYAIFITFLLTVISGSILLFVYFNSIVVDNYILLSQAEKTLNSAIDIFLANPTIVASNSQTKISPFSDSDEPVVLERKYWGVYEQIEAELKSGNSIKKQIAFIGKKQDNHPAIYLKKDVNELEISGNTDIKGVCYVPNAIIRKTYIAGYPNPGINALPKYIRKSDQNLIALNNTTVNSVNFFKNNPELKKQAVFFEKLPDTLDQSFTDSTLILFSDKAIEINNKDMSGNIVLLSTEQINVHPNSSMKNIILYAPRIVFLSGCINTVQCFAEETISVDNNCTFEYPSCLAILSTGLVSTNIIIGDNSTINGEIILDNAKDKTSSVIINKSATINGLIYSNASIELYGSVNGSVYANQFIHKTKSTQYKNQLIDARINLYNISDHYLYSSVLEKNSNFGIIKWLN